MKSRIGTVLIALAIVVPAARVSADEWSIEPTLQLGSQFNDNPRLLQSPDKDAYAAVVDASAQLAWRSQAAELAARPAVHVAQYSSYDQLNSTDGSLVLAYTQATEYGQFGVNAHVSLDHTLSSELETTGIVEANRRRLNYRIAMTTQKRLSERLTMGSEIAFEASDFAADPLRLLVDYRYASLSAYAEQVLDERTRMTMTASAGGVRGAQIVTESNDYTLRIGLSRNWDERWTSSLSIGPSLVTPKGAPSSRGLIFLAELAHSSEIARWNLTALRELKATGRGPAGRTRRVVRPPTTAPLSETWSSDAALRLIRSQESYTGSFRSDLRRTYGRAEAASPGNGVRSGSCACRTPTPGSTMIPTPMIHSATKCPSW